MKFGWGSWLIVTIAAVIFFPALILVILGVFLVMIMAGGAAG
jgi:hypothetical protein